MLDLDKLTALQKDGITSIDTLKEQEQDLLVGFVSMAARDIMKYSQQQHLSTSMALVNAFHFGLGLGLKLKIENGEVKER
jgi:hypothetical protein